MDQHEFILRPLLLSLSTAAALREVRRRVLATRYRVLSLGTLAELKALPPGSAFKLLILCHSLTKQECLESLDLAHAHWPEMPVMHIAAPFSPCDMERVDGAIGALAGPKAMFQEIERLMAAAAERNARPGVPLAPMHGSYARYCLGLVRLSRWAECDWGSP